MFKNKIVWMIIFIVLALLTVWAVCSMSRSFSLEVMEETLKSADTSWLIAAGLCVFINIYSEGRAIEILIGGLLGRKNRKGILYSSADIYFSAITPSSTGGQPASAFFMIKDGISAAETTVILVINLIMYSLALIAAGIAGLIVCNELIDDFGTLSRILIVFGYVMLGGMFILFILMLKKQNWIRALARGYAYIGSRFHIVKDKQRVFDRTERLISQYTECAAKVRGKSSMLIRAFLCNLVQRFCMIGTSMCIYMAIGGSHGALGSVFGVQTYAFIGSFGIPIPGAVGAADYLMIDGFSHIPDIASPANFELMSRGLSFYCCIAISFAITVAGYIITNRKNRGEL